ncbi:MAG: glucoamylase family protein [Candidatus Aenigmatarchaeota archaeon]
MKKGYYFFSIFFLFFTLISAKQIDEFEELVIDNFEAKKFFNCLGCLANTWQKDPNDPNSFCKGEFIEDNLNGQKSTVLKLTYKVTSDSYCGYYSLLTGLDASLYDNLEFYIKLQNSIPDSIILELKNHLNEIGKYELNFSEFDINRWKKISIPLNNFVGITDFSRLREFTIVFDGNLRGDVESVVFLDDIKLSALKEEYNKKKEILFEKIKQKKLKLSSYAKLSDDELLELISKRLFNYFYENKSPRTGFIKDRSTVFSPSSIAATGFGLTAFCIADFRGWIPKRQSERIVKLILQSIKYKLEKDMGYYYHFVDMHTGKRAGNSEVSSVDTALLLAGVIVAREYFDNPKIKKLCDEIYLSVEWDKFLEPKTKLLYMGWDPENGFKNYVLWDHFAEAMILYILALGSPTNSIPEESWHAFRRPVKTYKDYTYIYCESESLFTYQYSHAYIDFRNISDIYANYFENSISATKANIEFCREYKDKYKTYKEGFWGLSASDGPDGYKNYGATPFTHDGTIPPYGIMASIVFTPEESLKTIRKMLTKDYSYKLWDDRYAFVSAFNLDRDWFSTEHIGIDVGISLLMIENYRSGFVWKYFMKNEYVKRGLKKAGFKDKKGKLNVAYLKKLNKEGTILSYLQKEYRAKMVKDINEIYNLDKKYFESFQIPEDLEFGNIKDINDLDAKFAFAWDEINLYFIIDVKDNRVLARETKKEIYKGDCVELYLVPESDTLFWGNKEHFQIIFSPDSVENRPISYAFFQDIEPKEDQVKFDVFLNQNGYKIVASIKWNFLNFSPKEGKYLGGSVAIHDIDDYNTPGKKINWSFKNYPTGIKLGKISLVK